MRRWFVGIVLAGVVHCGAQAANMGNGQYTSSLRASAAAAAALWRRCRSHCRAAGQTVVVDNRVPLLAYDQVSKAAPDGYTLYVAGAYFPVLRLLQPTSVTADPVRDFTPIVQTEVTPLMVVVNPSVPVINSMQELIALIKQKPGQLNVSTGAFGGAGDLGGEDSGSQYRPRRRQRPLQRHSQVAAGCNVR